VEWEPSRGEWDPLLAEQSASDLRPSPGESREGVLWPSLSLGLPSVHQTDGGSGVTRVGTPSVHRRADRGCWVGALSPGSREEGCGPRCRWVRPRCTRGQMGLAAEGPLVHRRWAHPRCTRGLKGAAVSGAAFPAPAPAPAPAAAAAAAAGCVQPPSLQRTFHWGCF